MPIFAAAAITKSRLISLPIKTEPTMATAFCTCSRFFGFRLSSCSGVRPNSLLISGISLDSMAASTAQSRPGMGTALTAPASSARLCSNLRLRLTAACMAVFSAAMFNAVGMDSNRGEGACYGFDQCGIASPVGSQNADTLAGKCRLANVLHNDRRQSACRRIVGCWIAAKCVLHEQHRVEQIGCLFGQAQRLS